MEDFTTRFQNSSPIMERYVLKDRYINLEPLKGLLKDTFPQCAEETFKVQA